MSGWEWLFLYPAVAPQKPWEPGLLRTTVRKMTEISWQPTGQVARELGQVTEKQVSKATGPAEISCQSACDLLEHLQN